MYRNENFLIIIIFLGEAPLREIFFRIPRSSIVRNEWQKLFIAWKFFIFLNEFVLSLKEKNAICDIWIFLVSVYVKAYFWCVFCCQSTSSGFQSLVKTFWISSYRSRYLLWCFKKTTQLFVVFEPLKCRTSFLWSEIIIRIKNANGQYLWSTPNKRDLSSEKFDVQVLIVSNAFWYDISNGANKKFLFILFYFVINVESRDIWMTYEFRRSLLLLLL